MSKVSDIYTVVQQRIWWTLHRNLYFLCPVEKVCLVAKSDVDSLHVTNIQDTTVILGSWTTVNVFAVVQLIPSNLEDFGYHGEKIRRSGQDAILYLDANGQLHKVNLSRPCFLINWLVFQLANYIHVYVCSTSRNCIWSILNDTKRTDLFLKDDKGIKTL